MSRRDMKRLQLLLKGLGPGTRLTLSSLVDFTMAVRKRVGWARAVEVNERRGYKADENRIFIGAFQ